MQGIWDSQKNLEKDFSDKARQILKKKKMGFVFSNFKTYYIQKLKGCIESSTKKEH